jgi:hypothetical protein
MDDSKKIGPLPSTEIIKLESNKDQWMMVKNKLLPYLKTSGIINKDGTNVRVQICITKVVSPDTKIFGTTSVVPDKDNNIPSAIMSGVQRTQLFYANFMEKGLWVLIGRITGKNEIPILIIYYEALDMAFYSQKLEGEDEKQFLPFNAQDN